MRDIASFQTFRRRILSQLAIPLICILALMFCIAGWFNYSNQQQRFYANLHEQSQHAAKRLQAELSRADTNTQTLASMLTVTEWRKDELPTYLFNILSERIRHSPLFYGSAIAFKPHTFEQQTRFAPYAYAHQGGAATLDIGRESYDYSDGQWEWWSQALKHPQGYWTAPYFDKDAGNALMVTFAQPFGPPENYTGVVTTDIALESLPHLLAIDQQHLVVVDHSGVLLAAPNYDETQQLHLQQWLLDNDDFNASAIMHNDIWKTSFTAADGTEYLASIISVAPIDWRIVVLMPTAQLHMAVLKDLSLLGLSLLLFVIILLLASYYTARRITQPLEQLEQGISDFSQGKVKLLPDPKRSVREILNLTHSFNTMALTLQQREQALLQARRSRFAQLIDGMGDKSFYCSMEPSYQLHQASDGVTKVLGLSPEMFKRKYARLFTNNAINDNNWQLMEQAFAGENVPPHQVEMLDVDRKLHRLDVFMQPLIDEQQQVCSVELLFTDVTEQFSAATWANAVLEAAPEAMLIIGESGKLVFTNTRCQTMLGYTAEQLLTMTVEDLMPEQYRQHHVHIRDDFFVNGQSRVMGFGKTFHVQRANGSEFPAQIGLSKLPKSVHGLNQIAASIHDMTEQLDAEKQLRDSESRFRSLATNVPVAIFRVYTHGQWPLEFVSDNIADITGYPTAYFFNNRLNAYSDIIVPEDLPKRIKVITDGIAEHRAVEVEYRLRHRDGSIRWVHERAKASYDDDGNSIYFDGSLNDITEIKLANERLSQSQRQFKSITESVPCTVFQLLVSANEQRQFTFISSAALATLGFHRDELLGNDNKLEPRIHPDDRNAIRKMLLGKQGMQWNRVFRYMHPNGDYRWLEAGARGSNTAEGLFWNGYVMDVSDRKQMEDKIARSEAHFRELFDYAGMGIVNVDVNGIIIDCNDFFGAALGTEAEQLQHRLFVDLLHEGRDEAQALLAGLILGEQQGFSIEWPLKVADGSHKWMAVNATVRGNDKRNSCSIVMTMADISAIKRLSQELLEARDQADAASRAKSDFLANMSHEIRTPMNAIIGMTQLCLQTELTPKQQDYVQKVERSSQSLLGILNDILDFSKIEAGKLAIEHVPFQLDNLLEDLADMFSQRAADKHLELLFSVAANVPGNLIGDPLRLNQILVNLIGNALKFTQQGEVTLTISEVIRDGDNITLKFAVKDTGIGLTEEQQQKLFKSFSQADSTTTRRYGGTGLGLAISKQLVELMGGNIGLESQFSHGSTFFFNVKLQVADNRAIKVERELEGLSVLVVDDNASARTILKETIESMGFVVDTAPSGYEALNKFKQRRYGLALIDWRMPEMDGIETAKALQQLDDSPLIIMVSAHASANLIEQLGEQGISGYVAKPASASRLLDVMMMALGHNGALPVRRKATAMEHLPMHQLRGKQILLVEDNEMNQDVASEFIKLAGMKLQIANNGQEALDALAQRDMDLVLMDCQMPVMDGYQATAAIRAQPQWRDLPIIAMTANAMAGDRERCLAAGMDDHLAKPIDVNLLFETLLHYLGEEDALADATPVQPSVSPTDEIICWPESTEIDVDRGLQLVQGSSRLYRRILQRFAAGQRDIVAQITLALEQQRTQDALRLAHTLRGLAGNLSNSALADDAQQLEQLIEQQQPYDAFMDKLAQRIATIVKAIDTWLEDNGAQESNVALVSSVQACELLAQFITHLEDASPQANDVLAEIELHADAALAKRLKPLTTMVAGYRYDEAITVSKELISELNCE